MSVSIEPEKIGPDLAGPMRRVAWGAAGPAAQLFARLRNVCRKRPVLVPLCLAAIPIAILALSTLGGTLGVSGPPLIYYVVKLGDLPIVVTERGNLESQDEVKVICEVDDIQGDGIQGTPILYVVPNGASVKVGDLLVELDSAGHQERLDRKILEAERARAEQIQAKVKYENQKTQNETKWAEAKLKVDLAELALKQFEDEEGGTFQIDLQNVELQIQEAQAGQLIEQTNLAGVEQLYKLGYRSSGELAQARLNALRAERQLATAVSKKKELVEYQYLKTKMELEGQLASAKRAMVQVDRDNEALLEQARAAMQAADEALKKEEELLARYREQVQKARILAPQEGMVAYAVEHSHFRRAEIGVGLPVYPRQTILTLPNLRKMQVRTAVHESVLDQIGVGMPVTVRVDALPDRSYKGAVKTVAVLPDQGSWMSSDTKVYETIITIEEELGQLKPGMSAVAEIHVANLRGVLSVPVQAIVQIKAETWCYVGAGGGVERCRVTLGRTNDRFVEVREGLEEGDRVVLNPMAILGEMKEAEGAPAAPAKELREEGKPPTAGEAPGGRQERPSKRGDGPDTGKDRRQGRGGKEETKRSS